MSRGFRNADVTVEVGARVAAEAVERAREIDADQARRAAERRAQGQSGICEDCGEAIESERLQFLPNATRCVHCQLARDQGQSLR